MNLVIVSDSITENERKTLSMHSEFDLRRKEDLMFFKRQETTTPSNKSRKTSSIVHT